LTVVSNPAPITSSKVATSSSSLSRSPSSSRTRISSVVMSSPGCSVLYAMSAGSAVLICRMTKAAFSGLVSEVVMTASTIAPTDFSKWSGTPNSSQVIRIGSGYA